jgi:tellurite resistance protein TerC
MLVQPWMWAVFSAVVLALLALDLGVVNRRAHRPSTREALGWSAGWVGIAALFGVGVGFTLGREAALTFAAGYLVEQALSVDNLFVFLVLFSFFKVPEEQRHRVLFWGILGALAMRAAMIFAGVALLGRFEWLLYVFGAFLLFTAGRMAFGGGDHVDPANNPALKLVRRLVPVTDGYRGSHFFVHEPAAPGGPVRRMATPLFVVLVLVETTDLVFAVDSIPAVFGVSREPFIVYTSNVFAILGLRSLFFVLDHVIGRFHLLRFGLAGVLAFVGAKMLLGHVWHVPTAMSLGVIATLLGASVVASLLVPPPAGATPESAAADPVSADPARAQAGAERTGLVTVDTPSPVDGPGAAAGAATRAEPTVSADRRPS